MIDAGKLSSTGNCLKGGTETGEGAAVIFAAGPNSQHVLSLQK